MRKDRVSLDAKMMGPEPIFTEDQKEDCLKEQEDGKVGSLWSKASGWYNYFYDIKIIFHLQWII